MQNLKNLNSNYFNRDLFDYQIPSEISFWRQMEVASISERCSSSGLKTPAWSTPLAFARLPSADLSATMLPTIWSCTLSYALSSLSECSC